MIPYMNVDLRSINLHYDQRMNWMLNSHQRITEERQQEKTNSSHKEKPLINMNQAMSMNQLNSRSVSLGVQTDSDLVQSYERSSKGHASGVFAGQGHLHCQPHPNLTIAKEEAGAAAAIRSLRQASSNSMPTDYDRNLIARLPIDEHHLAQLHPHPHHIPKLEPGTNGSGPPYYGETDFDTNYYGKLDCNQLRTIKDQAGNTVLPNGTHLTDGDTKPGVFDVRNAPCSLYNDASGLFSQNSSLPVEGGKGPNEGHIVNRKPNAIVRLGGEEVTCEVCHKKFPHMWLLKIHSTKHTGRRLRTCQLCSNAFVAAFGGSATKRRKSRPPQTNECDSSNDRLYPNQPSTPYQHAPFHSQDRINGNLSGMPYNPTQSYERETFNNSNNYSNAIEQNRSETSSLSPTPSTTSSTTTSMSLCSSASPSINPMAVAASPTTHHCDLCNRLFTPPNDSDHDDDLHSSMSLGKVYTCDVCNRSYSTLGNLKQHKEKHYGEKNFVCEKCNKSFFTAGNLKQHLITHTGEKSFLCKLCNKTYSTSGNLRQHLMTHEGQKTNFCVICNRSFSTLGNLKQHMLTHFATNLYPCEVCKKSYSTLGNLKQHMLTHTGQKIFPCDKCDKTFTTLGNAKQHMIRHSGEKPYVCQTCSKSFFTLGNLKQHALTHSEEKLYKCDKCTKSFYTLSNLKQHSATHSDIKKTYVCEICSRSFSTFGNLKQHKLKHSFNINQVPAITQAPA